MTQSIEESDTAIFGRRPTSAAYFLADRALDGCQSVLRPTIEQKTQTAGPFVTGDLSFRSAGALSSVDALHGMKLPALFSLNTNKHALHRFNDAFVAAICACQEATKHNLPLYEHLPCPLAGQIFESLLQEFIEQSDALPARLSDQFLIIPF
eukprot:GHVP01053677.1.p2 GENE.GHVP01053677.1~~GHVP01053677.1.p2  ORF type:complete len:152 (-),score=10.75 GHVP01053677.1:764-1219(-)